MLEKCIAHLVARGEVQTRALTKIATRAGFIEMQPVLSRAEFGARITTLRLNYFLVHHELGNDLLKAVLRSVRSSVIDEVRYSPIVLFATDGPFETYLEYIDMGFDDIITLPEKGEIMVQRLTAQIDTEYLYFETGTYFGPDRRRMEVAAPSEHKRSSAPHSHVRYAFRRDPDKGVVVLRRDSYLALGHQPLKIERVG